MYGSDTRCLILDFKLNDTQKKCANTDRGSYEANIVMGYPEVFSGGKGNHGYRGHNACKNTVCPKKTCPLMKPEPPCFTSHKHRRGSARDHRQEPNDHESRMEKQKSIESIHRDHFSCVPTVAFAVFDPEILHSAVTSSMSP